MGHNVHFQNFGKGGKGNLTNNTHGTCMNMGSFIPHSKGVDF